MADKPKCSVLLPVYNNNEDIINAIQSVVNQKYPAWELIIVDDCSTDKTYQIVSDFVKNNPSLPIKLARNTVNRGVYISMNEALKMASGTYIALINSDDKYHPDILVESIDYLEKNKNLVAVISKYQREEKIVYAPVTLVYRKTIINEIGYYDSVRFGADSEFFERMMHKYSQNRIKYINKILYIAKNRPNSLTTNTKTGLKGPAREARNEYVAQYRKWHKTNVLFIDYPQTRRPYPVPQIMKP